MIKISKLSLLALVSVCFCTANAYSDEIDKTGVADPTCKSGLTFVWDLSRITTDSGPRLADLAYKTEVLDWTSQSGDTKTLTINPFTSEYAPIYDAVWDVMYDGTKVATAIPGQRLSITNAMVPEGSTVYLVPNSTCRSRAVTVDNMPAEGLVPDNMIAVTMDTGTQTVSRIASYETVDGVTTFSPVDLFNETIVSAFDGSGYLLRGYSSAQIEASRTYRPSFAEEFENESTFNYVTRDTTKLNTRTITLNPVIAFKCNSNTVEVCETDTKDATAQCTSTIYDDGAVSYTNSCCGTGYHL